MKAFILTEGKKNTGFGHMARCTSLCQAFEEKGISPEFIINGDHSTKGLLQNRQHTIINWLERRDEILDLVGGADIVLIDSYLAEYDFYKKISELAKLPVYMDDFMRYDYPKGVVINGALFAEDLDYPDREGVIYMLGIQYFPIRQIFWDISRKRIRGRVQNIMVTFGGDDSEKMTVPILKLLAAEYPFMKKKVIIGKGFDNIREIESLSDKNTEIIYCPDGEGMKKIMIESDICISAAGQTLYELARVGVPTITIMTADNQANNIIGWQKAGSIEYAGSSKDIDIFNKVKKGIDALEKKDYRAQKAKAGFAIIDGKGPRRSVERVLQIYGDLFQRDDLRNRLRKNIQIDNAFLLSFANMNTEEKEMVRSWRNHKSIRAWMYHDHIISREEHAAYLEKLNRDDKSFSWIVKKSNNLNIGVIAITRFDYTNKNALLGVYACPDNKAETDSRLLIDCLKHIAFKICDLHTLKLELLDNNIRALKYYKKAGFSEEGRLREFIYKDGRWHDVIIMGAINE
jgi:UDP-4-amino-4,6-dideoxy-N-acetyl-beta-L-altrosamine N-acetyltransferase